MSYNNAIPQPTDRISNSQSQLLENFSQIETVFSLNHVNFNNGGDSGKHSYVEFKEQAIDPAVVVDQWTMYSKDDGTNNQIYLRSPSNYTGTIGAGTVFPFTTFDGSANGWTRLPSGLVMKWGTGSANGSLVVNMSQGPAFAATPLFISVTPLTGINPVNVAITVTALAATNFTVFGSQRTTTTATSVPFYYLAIGI